MGTFLLRAHAIDPADYEGQDIYGPEVIEEGAHLRSAADLDPAHIDPAQAIVTEAMREAARHG